MTVVAGSSPKKLYDIVLQHHMFTASVSAGSDDKGWFMLAKTTKKQPLKIRAMVKCFPFFDQ